MNKNDVSVRSEDDAPFSDTTEELNAIFIHREHGAEGAV